MLIKEIQPNNLHDMLIHDQNSDWTWDEADCLTNYYMDLSSETNEHVLVDILEIGHKWHRIKDLNEARSTYDNITGIESLRDIVNVVECKDTFLVSEYEY